MSKHFALPLAMATLGLGCGGSVSPVQGPSAMARPQGPDRILLPTGGVTRLAPPGAKLAWSAEGGIVDPEGTYQAPMSPGSTGCLAVKPGAVCRNCRSRCGNLKLRRPLPRPRIRCSCCRRKSG